MKYLVPMIVVASIALAACDSRKSRAPSDRSDAKRTRQHINWPDLPTAGFVSGRLATPDDVERGAAAFAAFGSVTSDAAGVPVPQYARVRDKSGSVTPAILIQAEIVHGPKGDAKTYGLKPLQGDGLIVAVDAEVELLGTKKPE